MSIAVLSFITLSLFMLHEFDEIILIRPWIEQEGDNPRFAEEMFIARKAAYPSAEVIALTIAEEFLLAFLILLSAIIWQIPELALALGFCHTLHLTAHIGETIRFQCWVPGGFTAVATFPFLLLTFALYLGNQSLSWPLLLLLCPILMAIILVNLSMMHSQAERLNTWIRTFTMKK